MSTHLFAILMTLLLLQFVHSQTIHTGSNIDCSGEEKCRDDTLSCDPNKDCNITCSGGRASCRNTNILCPINGNCHINCEPGFDDVCRETFINATASKSVTWHCPQNTDACDKFILYCPVNGHLGPIQCRITNVTKTAIHSTNSNIYAVEGFNDIEITGVSIEDVKIHCGENYGTMCKMENVLNPPFECAECKNILSPSQYPTLSPTNNPTHIPTLTPSHPTFNPTFIPSLFPTNNPTINPTTHPTYNPSLTPTYNPTYPTLYPTENPLTHSDGEHEVTSVNLLTSTSEAQHADSSHIVNSDNSDRLLTIVIMLGSVTGGLLVIISILVCLIIWKSKNTKIEKQNMEHVLTNSSLIFAKTDSFVQNIQEEQHHDQANEQFLCEGNGINSVDVTYAKQEKKTGFYARAINDYNDSDEDQLDLKEDGIFWIVHSTENGWWYGINEYGNDGWVPSNYMKKLDLNEQNELKKQQKEKTDDGIDLLTELMDKSYQNIQNNQFVFDMPPKIPPVRTVMITDAGSSSDDDDSISNETLENKTVGKITNDDRNIIEMTSSSKC